MPNNGYSKNATAELIIFYVLLVLFIIYTLVSCHTGAQQPQGDKHHVAHHSPDMIPGLYILVI